MIKFKIDGISYEIPDIMSIENYVKIFKVKDLFTEEYFAAKLINIVTGAPIKDLLEGGVEEVNYLSSVIMETIPRQDDIKFSDRFILNGVHYGFFPNWKELTFAEFVDMDTISSKKPEDLFNMLHILAAIMYRPIINERSEHDYDIEPYNILTLNERAELFKKQLDAKYILGAQFFFIKFAERYSIYTPLFLIPTKLSLLKQMGLMWTFWRMIYKTHSLKRLGGFWSLTKLLTMTLQNMNTSSRRTL